MKPVELASAEAQRLFREIARVLEGSSLDDAMDALTNHVANGIAIEARTRGEAHFRLLGVAEGIRGSIDANWSLTGKP